MGLICLVEKCRVYKQLIIRRLGSIPLQRVSKNSRIQFDGLQ